jgi:elongation factor Ts
MAEISAKDVMALRNKLGISMMECKKALVETNGNEELAIELLRKKGAAKAAKKSDRSTGEGTVVFSEKSYLKLLCETDFVARNENFISFAKEIVNISKNESIEKAKEFFENNKSERITQLGENIVLEEIGNIDGESFGGYIHSNNKIGTIIGVKGNASKELLTDLGMHATAIKPTVISPEEISNELVAKEKDIWVEQLKNEGKPDKIIENILKGKENKFRNEGAFIEQEFVKDPTKKIKDLLKDNNIEITEFKIITI